MSATPIPRTALRLSWKTAPLVSRRPIDSPCRTLGSHHLPSIRPRASTPQCHAHALRSLSVSASLHRKVAKANKAHAQTDASPPVSTPTATDEAYDVSHLEAQVLKAMEKLTHDLSQLRGGGKLNPDMIENLKVQLGTAGHGKETVKLRDIAQVVPRGRVIHVVCGEDTHIKPITSAIAASPHSLTPLAPDASNPLTIQVPLPPPTGESRRAAVDAATKASEKADKMIQTARQDHNKRLRKFELNRDVLPDDLQKAKKRMEEVVKKGHTEVKRISDGAKRVLESQ
ncbi:ribosome-recycling factor [Pleosporales sp. CAS-2024a]